MVSVFDVAKYILEQKGRMSTWKLQKLCYYSQAWHYTWTEKRLIEEDFQAWRNGPVCPELFQAHQGKFMIAADELSKGSPEKLSDDEKDSVDEVLKGYGDDEPYYLRQLTHEEAPWKDARGDLPEDAKSHTVISLESMGEYYGEQIYD